MPVFPGWKPGLGAARRVPRDVHRPSFTTGRRAAPPSRRFSGGIAARRDRVRDDWLHPESDRRPGRPLPHRTGAGAGWDGLSGPARANGPAGGSAAMKVGLVGFAGSGKTTVFNTMTGLAVPTGYGGELRL